MKLSAAILIAFIGLNTMTAKSWATAQTFETTATPLALEHGVHVRKVHFPNHSIDIVGNLFTPSGYDAAKAKKYPAIIVTHPNGGVKEQTAGLYAQKLAEKGFIALAYDASYQGESGGEPRFTEAPSSRVEDIRCAADFLSNHPPDHPPSNPSPRRVYVPVEATRFTQLRRKSD